MPIPGARQMLCLISHHNRISHLTLSKEYPVVRDLPLGRLLLGLFEHRPRLRKDRVKFQILSRSGIGGVVPLLPEGICMIHIKYEKRGREEGEGGLHQEQMNQGWFDKMP